MVLQPNLKIQTWFEVFFAQSCRILTITTEIARHSGELRGQLKSRGKTHTQTDMMIAATAQIHQLTLVTCNIRDFEHCPIALLNPFI